MKKLLVIFLVFLLALGITEVSIYLTFHFVYKPDVFNEWYEIVCYCIGVLVAGYYVYLYKKKEL